ncbi:endothelin-converting enzyme 2-like [Tachypleus tridentatus]|uniref:endothelin-converting enzyme 2-like n=1 Tax=Tachypleus tridentatus TaxID=6853 RepID=UPI003FD31A3D
MASSSTIMLHADNLKGPPASCRVLLFLKMMNAKPQYIFLGTICGFDVEMSTELRCFMSRDSLSGRSFCGTLHVPSDERSFCWTLHVLSDERSFCWTLHVPSDERSFCGTLHVPSDDEPFHSSPSETSFSLSIEPANIGLPDPSYYHTPNEDQIIRAYKKFIQELANEFSCKPGHAYHFSEKIFQFEKEIAKILPSREMLLNSEESYKKMSIKELRSLAPNFKWLDLLQACFSPSGIHVEMQVAVVYPQYFEHLFYLVATKTDEDINNYLMWRFQLHYLEHLPVRFQYLLTKFRQSLEGVEDHQVKEEERWHFCLRQTNHFMGIAMGNMYIKKYLSSDIKLEAETVLNKTKESFVRAIGGIGWLHNEEEQETAKRKINSLIVLWGYPDILLDENKITDYYVEFIVRTNYLQNVFEGEYFLWKKKQKNLLSSPIPESWSVLPQSVESVYETLGNHLGKKFTVFLLVVLSPTFYNLKVCMQTIDKEL